MNARYIDRPRVGRFLPGIGRLHFEDKPIADA
jgi:hypothetical protein